MAETDWKDFGRWIGKRRSQLRLPKTEAARRSGLSYTTWVTYENGGRSYRGEWIEPAPNDATLDAIAHALDLPRSDVFARAGRPLSETADIAEGWSVHGEPFARLADLSDSDLRAELKALVDELIRRGGTP